MKLDTEQDRQVLTQLIEQSQVPGGAVLIIADLLTRIKSAEIENAPEEVPKK